MCESEEGSEEDVIRASTSTVTASASSATVSVLVGLSSRHLENAEIFKDQASEIEAIYHDHDHRLIPNDVKKRHTAFTMNALVSSASFVESWFKEFLFKISEDVERAEKGNKLHYPNLDSNTREQILTADNLDKRLRKASSPIKYNVILDIAELDEFDRNSTPLEQLILLNWMRNKLVHYEPKWQEGGIEDDLENVYGFEESLQGRFELNPLAASGDPFFPTQCLSASCADWAIRHVKGFNRNFSGRMGIEYNL
ncbi:hypothetical protein ACH9L7_11320 [Haloferax sp. S1W]|uniref:hypothetical protein n=1 Tax=Haloferax sp. S1W TaxID=3377110 RepID=UPI0037C746A9